MQLFNIGTRVNTQDVAKCWSNFGQGKITFKYFLEDSVTYISLLKLTFSYVILSWLFLLDKKK